MTDAPYAPLIAKLRAAAEDALYASIRAACIEAADALTAAQERIVELEVHVRDLRRSMQEADEEAAREDEERERALRRVHP